MFIRPGERIPADGSVLAGRSSVNQGPITGESIPVDKEPGGFVYGGSLNGEGALQVRVTQTADQSTPARIARLIEQAQATPSRTERVVDQFARRYTPAVIGLAVALSVLPPLLGWWDPSVVGWEAGGGWAFWKEWLFRSLVLLIIACPCALVISTPITILCGLHRASRLGILIKGGEFLENIGRVRWMALDKTGTVTKGQPKVVAVEPQSGHSESEVLTVAAALEQHSEHPLAQAIVAEARRRNLTWVAIDDLQTTRGLGVQATFEGQPCAVGSLRFFQQQGWLVDSPSPAERPGEGAASIVAVAHAGDVWGFILLRDLPRDNAQSILQQWRSLGVQRLVMLTGDHEPVARQVAHELGFDAYHADLLPEDKMEQIRRLAEREPALAMIGDGVNDAPALAAAPIGLALGSDASDVALESADIAILSPHLQRVTDLMQLSIRTRRILYQNIALAIGIKFGVLLLAVAGRATMWIAVASDVGASLLVIFNGMRLLRSTHESAIKGEETRTASSTGSPERHA